MSLQENIENEAIKKALERFRIDLKNETRSRYSGNAFKKKTLIEVFQNYDSNSSHLSFKDILKILKEAYVKDHLEKYVNKVEDEFYKKVMEDKK